MAGRILILVIPLATASIAASVVGARLATKSDRSMRHDVGDSVSRSLSEASPVEALNDSIQERFRTLDGFGMSRFPVVPQHVHRFDPRTPKEKMAVEDLRSQGWTVGLYLGGLGLLEPPMSQSEWEKAGEFSLRKAISQPLVIAGETTTAGLPEPWKLQAIGRGALEASTASDRYAATVGRWSVDVRPIRANRTVCLKCHAGEGLASYRRPGTDQEADLKVGDALGVAVYVYARKPD